MLEERNEKKKILFYIKLDPGACFMVDAHTFTVLCAFRKKIYYWKKFKSW